MANGVWVILNVDNVDKSVEFYRSLGFKTSVDSVDNIPGVASAPMGSVETGGSGLVLWDKHVVPTNQPENTRAWVSGELGKGVLIAIGVPNAERIWKNAQKVRAEVEQPLTKQPYGGNEFTIIDLDGYVINVTDKFPGPSSSTRAKTSTARKAKPTKAKTTARKVAGKGKRR